MYGFHYTVNYTILFDNSCSNIALKLNTKLANQTTNGTAWAIKSQGPGGVHEWYKECKTLVMGIIQSKGTVLTVLSIHQCTERRLSAEGQHWIVGGYATSHFIPRVSVLLQLSHMIRNTHLSCCHRFGRRCCLLFVTISFDSSWERYQDRGCRNGVC